ncbi:MAG: hypothetical protein KKG33_14010 [candidate division Zixibacteria bacterium]|nr:hypothetical protein [candidate division Zixibacteria bacterium]
MTEEWEPDPESAEIVREAIFEVVENQMRDNDPPETRQTYDRLIAEGHPEEEVMKMIGCVITTELWEMETAKEMFNRKRFVKNLKRLPKLPW